MREIKFRAWDKELKKMVEIKYIDWFVNSSSGDVPSWISVTRIVLDEDGKYCRTDEYEDTLKRFKLLQFTGLKDKNGKEIYEGDILKTPYNDTYDFAYYKVIYRENEGRFWRKCVALHHKIDGFKDISHGGYCEGGLNCSREVLEVIGNIYENPELLEGEK